MTFRDRLLGSTRITFAPDGGAGTGGSEGAPGGGEGAPAGGSGGAGGGAQPDWTMGFDPDVKTFVTTKGYKSPGELAKAYINAEKLIGAEKLPIPGKDAPQEVWDAAYDRLGRPKDGKYNAAKPEGAGAEYDAFVGRLSKHAHANGWNQKQFDAQLGFMTELATEAGAAAERQQKEAHDAGVAKLRAKWGVKYDAEVETANRGGAWLSKQVPAFKALVDRMGLMNETTFIEAMNVLGAAAGEDTIRGSGSGGSFGMTPAEAKAEISKMEGDKTHPLWIKNHPEHGLAVQRRNDLYKMANPEGETPSGVTNVAA